MDLYHRFRRNASEQRLVWIGRVATVVMTLIGLVWIPVIRYAPKGLYDYLQSVQGYLAPPIFVVFFLGVFWSRLNSRGCLAALIVGFAMGIFRLAVDTPVKLKMWGVDQAGNAVEYAEGSFLWFVNHLYFQYYSLLIFLVSVLVMVVVSYTSVAPSAAQIQGLTYGTRTEEQRRKTRESWSAFDVFTSVVVMAAIIAAYLYFRG
jgi:SSS family solute:Na+ symporter